VLAQRLGQLLGDRQHLAQQHSPRGALLAHAIDRLDHAKLEFLAEALHPPHAALGGGLAQIVEARDAELVVESARGLCPQAGEPRDFDQRGREPGLQLRGGGDLAGVDQVDDLPLQRRSDPGELGGLAREREIGDRDRAALDHAGCLAVRDHSVADGAVELVQRRELGHGGGDLGVTHGPLTLDCSA
jgi:hypothetical protein